MSHLQPLAEKVGILCGVAIIAAASGRVLAERVAWASSPLQRVRGLLFRPPLRPGDALVIERASQVHTFGLPYAIDVVFCDSDWRALHVVRGMSPMRVTRWVRAAYVLELPAGALPDEVGIGARLRITGARRSPS